MWAKIIKSFSIMFIVLFNICVVKNGISFLNNTAEFLFILQSWTIMGEMKIFLQDDFKIILIFFLVFGST